MARPIPSTTNPEDYKSYWEGIINGSALAERVAKHTGTFFQDLKISFVAWHRAQPNPEQLKPDGVVRAIQKCPQGENLLDTVLLQLIKEHDALATTLSAQIPIREQHVQSAYPCRATRFLQAAIGRGLFLTTPFTKVSKHGKKKSWTQLHLACHFGLTEIAAELLKKAEVSASTPDSVGNTPLHHAAKNRVGDAEGKRLVELLFERQEVSTVRDLKNHRGRFALYNACRKSYVETIRQLAHGGCDLFLTTGLERTALEQMDSPGKERVISTLYPLMYAQNSEKAFDIWLALLENALKMGNYGGDVVAQYLLPLVQGNLDYKYDRKEVHPYLELASQYPVSQETLRLLLQKIRLHIQDVELLARSAEWFKLIDPAHLAGNFNDYRQLYLLSIRHGHLQLLEHLETRCLAKSFVKEMLNRSDAKERPLNSDEDPFLIAIAGGHLAIIRHFAEQKGRVSQKHIEFALTRGAYPIAFFLLGNCSPDYLPPLWEGRPARSLRLFIEYICSAEEEAPEIEKHRILRKVLRPADDLEPSNPERQSALHFAADSGHYLLLRSLLGHFSQKLYSWTFKKAVNAQRTDQKAPLHLALEALSIPCALLLVRHGANVRLPDGNGKTAIKLAEELKLWPFLRFLWSERVIKAQELADPSPLFTQAFREKRAVEFYEAEIKPLEKKPAFLQSSALLNVACRHNKTALVYDLRAAGYPVDQPDGWGRLPLHWSATYRWEESTHSLLVQDTPDPFVQDLGFQTADQLRERDQSREMFELFGQKVFTYEWKDKELHQDLKQWASFCDNPFEIAALFHGVEGAFWAEVDHFPSSFREVLEKFPKIERVLSSDGSGQISQQVYHDTLLTQLSSALVVLFLQQSPLKLLQRSRGEATRAANRGEKGVGDRAVEMMGLLEPALEPISEVISHIAEKIPHSKIVELFKEAFELIPLPVIKAILKGGIELIQEHVDEKKIHNTKAAFRGLDPISLTMIARDIVERLSRMYEEQVALLTPEGAEMFAQCSVLRIVAALLNGYFRDKDDLVKSACLAVRILKVEQNPKTFLGFPIPFTHQPLSALHASDLTEDFLHRKGGIAIQVEDNWIYYANDDQPGGTSAAAIGYMHLEASEWDDKEHYIATSQPLNAIHRLSGL